MNRHPNVQQDRYAEPKRTVAAQGESKQVTATDLADLDHSGQCKMTNDQ